MKIYRCNHKSTEFDILEICKMFRNSKRSLSYLCKHLSVIDYTKVYNSLASMEEAVNPHQSPLNKEETFLNDSQIFVKFCEWRNEKDESEVFSCGSSHVESGKSLEKNLKCVSKKVKLKSKNDDDNFVPVRQILLLRIVSRRTTTIFFIVVLFSLILIMLTSHHISN